MRDLLRENGRIVGVRTGAAEGPREYLADLVVGADGRHAATRKHSGLPELSGSQEVYDILWLKVPYPDRYPDRATMLMSREADRAGLETGVVRMTRPSQTQGVPPSLEPGPFRRPPG